MRWLAAYYDLGSKTHIDPRISANGSSNNNTQYDVDVATQVVSARLNFLLFKP